MPASTAACFSCAVAGLSLMNVVSAPSRLTATAFTPPLTTGENVSASLAPDIKSVRRNVVTKLSFYLGDCEAICFWQAFEALRIDALGYCLALPADACFLSLLGSHLFWEATL